jgi:hypothetical protein
MDSIEDIVKKGEEWREKRRLYKRKTAERIKELRNCGKQLEWRKTKHTCGCGSVYNNHTKSQHIKTKKHTDWLVKQASNPT